jgi:hypothetical protein
VCTPPPPPHCWNEIFSHSVYVYFTFLLQVLLLSPEADLRPRPSTNRDIEKSLSPTSGEPEFVAQYFFEIPASEL